ncbi:thiamine pyrophosphate-binding protein [soil metagenome]
MIARALADAGVEWAFTVPGESFLGVLDALPEAGIRVVATRHEGGAAFMAEAVGQLTGRPAACLGTRAVGAANLAIGIHTARQNSTPMVALVGQVERAFRGREAFQEVDQVGTFGRLAKWAAEIDDPARAPGVVSDGLREMAGGRPGPVLFSLPEDVLDKPTADDPPDVTPAPAPAVDPAAVAPVIRMLAEAERPLILAGGGVLRARATDRLVALAEALRVPVMAAWRRPDVFPHENPLYLGMTGYGSPPPVAARTLAADALLVVGCRLSEVASFGYRLPADHTRWAHVDLEPRTGDGGLRRPDLALAADAGAFLDAAIKAAIELAPTGDGPPSEPSEALDGDRAAFVAASVVDAAPWDGPGVHPGRVVATLQRVLPPNAILTTDAGNFGLWPARGYRFNQPGTFLGPTSGAMGYGLPAAIAASLCRPDRQVVAMCGDGGMAMLMAELETAVREGAQPVILVFDNRRYGTIAMHQLREGRSEVAVELGPVDFAAVARACGAQGGRVTRDAEFEPALRDALAADRPAVLQLELDPAWLSPDAGPGSA